MLANILLVEDEKSIVTLIKYNLEKEGFKVFCSETGEDALKIIKEKTPDLVILDWMLPDTSGINVCRQIKLDKKLKTLGPDIMDLDTCLLYTSDAADE